MYAVIETGGKQYRVEVGTELEVELLDVEPGKTVTLDRVLLVADGDEASIGRPLVENASVDAEVVRQDRGDKVISFKYRPKARRRVKKGHRQDLTILRITDVRLCSKSAAGTAMLQIQPLSGTSTGSSGESFIGVPSDSGGCSTRRSPCRRTKRRTRCSCQSP